MPANLAFGFEVEIRLPAVIPLSSIARSMACWSPSLSDLEAIYER